MRRHDPTLMPALVMAVVSALSSGPTLTAQTSPGEFARAYEAFRQGPAYEANIPTGRLELTRENADGLLHRYLLLVPEGYDPARRYPVAVYLHGGVGRPDPGPGGGWWRNTERVASEDQIAVIPLSTRESLWWQASQVENLNAILTELKQTYNVDENRVFATGISDGGTGVYFLGFRDTTPWAGFLPFIGYPGVLLNPRVGVDGIMHLANLVNKPFFIVNGETDRLYPVRNMAPFLAVREVNTVTIQAYHASRFRLLISPEEFDLGRPIRVVTNGEVSFEGLVEPRVATLRKWAARDHDRTMLFAAEIAVEMESR